MAYFTIIAVAICFVGILAKAVFDLVYPKKSAPISRFPGPRPLPYIGNLLSTPIWGAVFHFKHLTDKYGPIAETTLLGQRCVLISKESIADDLLVGQGKVLSGRPCTFAVKDAQSKFGTAEYVPLMSFNEDQKLHKRVGRTYLTGMKAKNHYEYPFIEATRLVWDLMFFGGQPQKDWIRMTEDFTSRIISRIVFGSPDHAEKLHWETWLLLIWVSPNGVLPNLIPFLDKLPFYLSPWKMMEWCRHRRQQGWYKFLLEQTRKDIKAGTAPPCLMRDYLSEKEGSSTYRDDEDAAKALGMIATAAIFTISGPLQNTIRALACFPEWQPKLQAEMEQVAAYPKIPTVADLPQLPLFRSFIRETTRWRQAIPSGIPHEAEDDVVYHEVHIPKGTAIFPLEQGMSRDPDVYERPADFDPMRWLDPASPNYREPLSLHPDLRNTPLFGWGRRYCMGHELAMDEIYVFAMHIIWSFDVKLTDPSSVERNLLPGEKRGGHQWPTAREQSLIIMRPEKIDIEFHTRKGRATAIRDKYDLACGIDTLRDYDRVDE